MKVSTKIKRLENKIANKEFNKPYNELNANDKIFIDYAVSDILSAQFNS